MNSFKKILGVTLIAATSALALAGTAEARKSHRQGLVVINDDNGRIYDDGYDDGIVCRVRTVIVGYDYWGDPIYRKRRSCRQFPTW